MMRTVLDAQDTQIDTPHIEMREYQQRIIGKAMDMLHGQCLGRDGRPLPEAQSVLIESPTGSGKTVMGLSIARALQRKHGYRVGWVAMRRNLLHQTASENQSRGFGVDLQLISMFEKEPPTVDVLIVDEAQHDAATSMGNLHSLIRPKKVIGLTATPFRTDRIKLCFDRVIKDAGIHQLIQDDYLSRYAHYTIPEFSPERIAKIYGDDPARWGKSLIFFARHEQCRQCSAFLAQRGVRSEVVTGTSDRERQLDDFQSNRLNVLINMNILTEGFDCPSLKTVFCRPSGRGCTLQMAGRVFRKHPSIALKQIVQCRKTRHPLPRTALADRQYVLIDDQWRSLTLNPRIDDVTMKARRAIGAAEVNLPKMLESRIGRDAEPYWGRDNFAEAAGDLF